MPDAFPAGRIASLDGLRALAVLSVLLAHQARYLPGTQPLASIAGPLGVQIFFVISGFLITTLLLRERALTGAISVPRFYARRALRILPVFYGFVLVVVALQMSHGISLPPGNLWYVLTYTANYAPAGCWWTGHLWSLAVEEQFYLIWPLMLRFFSMATNRQAAIALVIAAPLLRLVAHNITPAHHPVWHRLFPSTAFPLMADAIACGCLLAMGLPFLAKAPTLQRLLGSPLAFWLLPALILLHSWSPRWHLFGAGLYAISGVTAMNFAIAFGVAKFTLFPVGMAGKFLNSRLLVIIGLLSYSLYVWQQLFFNAGGHTLLQRPMINLGVTFAVAGASYYGLERPLLGLRRRWRSGPAATPRAGPTQGILATPVPVLQKMV